MFWPKEVHDFLLAMGFEYNLEGNNYLHYREAPGAPMGFCPDGTQDLAAYFQDRYNDRDDSEEVASLEYDLAELREEMKEKEYLHKKKVDLMEDTAQRRRVRVKELKLEVKRLEASLKNRDKMIARMKLQRPLPRKKNEQA